jgi:hypothetical protein
MSKLINFNQTSDYEEVADSIGDALEVIQAAENALEDGLQIGDAFVLLSSEDEVREIINDTPTFLAQTKKLTAETSQASVLEAGERILSNGKPVGPITRFIMNGLWSVVTGYSSALAILQIGQSQLLEKQALIAGQDIFPPLLTAPAAA